MKRKRKTPLPKSPTRKELVEEINMLRLECQAQREELIFLRERSHAHTWLKQFSQELLIGLRNGLSEGSLPRRPE